MRLKLWILSAWLLVSLVSLSGTALSAISTGTLTVSTEISEVCSIRSIADVDFGLYNPLSPADLDARGSFSFICLPTMLYELYINGLRQMSFGADVLNYELYTDDARTVSWPYDSPSIETGVVPNADVITRNVYARIPARQFVPRGPYEGFVTIVINF